MTCGTMVLAGMLLAGAIGGGLGLLLGMWVQYMRDRRAFFVRAR